MDIEGTYLNIIKAIIISHKPRANIIFNSEKLKSSPRSGPKQESGPRQSLLLLNIVLKFLARTIRHKK